MWYAWFTHNVVGFQLRERHVSIVYVLSLERFPLRSSYLGIVSPNDTCIESALRTMVQAHITLTIHVVFVVGSSFLRRALLYV